MTLHTPAAKLHGLIAATHTPFDASGQLNLTAVERQAEHLHGDGVKGVFVGGTTGECLSLTVEERLALAKRWSEVVRNTHQRLIVHVGANCLADSRTLAAQAQSLGAYAVAMLAPSYFKPRSIEALVGCCAEVASAAPGTPFYYYDIPSMTGVQLSSPDFLLAAAGDSAAGALTGGSRIPTLTGIKFTNTDLLAYQRCLHVHDGRFDIPYGLDEALLAAVAVGAVGAVGSSYNFAAPIYHQVLADVAEGDLPAARAAQFRAVQMIDVLAGVGYLPATKAVMSFRGVDVGQTRLPLSPLTSKQLGDLRTSLENLGFFDWIAK